MLEVLFRPEAAYRDRVLDAVTEAGRDLGLSALWLFGSVARFDDRRDSDLDILMVSAAPDPASHERIADTLRQRLAGAAELTGLRPPVIAVAMDDLKAPIGTRHSVRVGAEHDVKVLLGRSPPALARQSGRRRWPDDQSRKERRKRCRSAGSGRTASQGEGVSPGRSGGFCDAGNRRA